jgi:hypothetical protein
MFKTISSYNYNMLVPNKEIHLKSNRIMDDVRKRDTYCFNPMEKKVDIILSEPRKRNVFLLT